MAVSVKQRQAILITDNDGHTGGVTSQGDAYFNSLTMSGGLLCVPVQAAGGVITNTIGNATPGQPVTINDELAVAAGLVIQGATPAGASGQLGLGATTATTATAGGGSTLPGIVLTWVQVNVGGILGKIPVFAN